MQWVLAISWSPLVTILAVMDICLTMLSATVDSRWFFSLRISQPTVGTIWRNQAGRMFGSNIRMTLPGLRKPRLVQHHSDIYRLQWRESRLWLISRSSDLCRLNISLWNQKLSASSRDFTQRLCESMFSKVFVEGWTIWWRIKVSSQISFQAEHNKTPVLCKDTNMHLNANWNCRQRMH